MPADQLCTHCHHLLTRHYNAGDIDATGCAQLGCPCEHDSTGPGMTPAEAAVTPAAVRSTVTQLTDFVAWPDLPAEVVAPTASETQGSTLWSSRAQEWHQHYEHTYLKGT